LGADDTVKDQSPICKDFFMALFHGQRGVIESLKQQRVCQFY